MTQTLDDSALLERIAAGDQAALRILHDRHYIRVYRFVIRITKSETAAEDVTNDVFLEVWRNASRFEGRASLSTWMLSIARNRSISTLRKRTEVQLDEDYANAVEDEADTPDIVVAKDDKGHAIRACMDLLSAEHREIIDLVYYHEKSVADVAAIVGIPEGTVKTRMFHARKKLGTLLANAGVDRGWP